VNFLEVRFLISRQLNSIYIIAWSARFILQNSAVICCREQNFPARKHTREKLAEG